MYTLEWPNMGVGKSSKYLHIEIDQSVHCSVQILLLLSTSVLGQPYPYGDKAAQYNIPQPQVTQ